MVIQNDDDVKKVSAQCFQMTEQEWRDLLSRLKSIDPSIFDALRGVVLGNGVATGPVNGVQVADPPRHETGNLS